MQCGTPICFFKPVLAVAALAGVGMAGFNLATTGCPLGSCSASSDATTSLVSISDQKSPGTSGCCAEAEPAVTLAAEPASGCCESMPSKAQAVQASLESGETCDGGPCKTECEETPATELVTDDAQPAEAGAEG